MAKDSVKESINLEICMKQKYGCKACPHLLLCFPEEIGKNEICYTTSTNEESLNIKNNKIKIKK